MRDVDDYTLRERVQTPRPSANTANSSNVAAVIRWMMVLVVLVVLVEARTRANAIICWIVGARYLLAIVSCESRVLIVNRDGQDVMR